MPLVKSGICYSGNKMNDALLIFIGVSKKLNNKQCEEFILLQSVFL
jgi:hypothetical protein